MAELLLWADLPEWQTPHTHKILEGGDEKQLPNSV